MKLKRKPPLDKHELVATEGSPCVLFSTNLADWYYYYLFMRCLFICCFSCLGTICYLVLSLEMISNQETICHPRMGKQEGMATQNEAKRKCHEAYLLDKQRGEKLEVNQYNICH